MSSNTAVAVKDDSDTVTFDNSISLKRFPPKLRKVAKILLSSNEPITLKEASEKANVLYDTVRQEIWKHKKKGNDFHQFIADIGDTFLHENLLAVDISTAKEAVLGTHQDRKLYYQRIGKLTEATANTQVHLAIGVNIAGFPPQDQARDKGVLDTQAFIPRGK